MGQAASTVRKAIKADQEEQKKQFDDTMESLRQMAQDKMDKFYEDIELAFPLAYLPICSLDPLTHLLEVESKTTSFCRCIISRANSLSSNARCQRTAMS